VFDNEFDDHEAAFNRLKAIIRLHCLSIWWASVE